jgi:hypothetical protein
MGTVFLATGLLAALAGRGRADDAAAIVEQAVRATVGSEQRLAKLANVVQTAHGTLSLPGGDVPVLRTAYISPPDRLKYDAQIGPPGQRQPLLICLNGVKGWQQITGAVQDLSPPQYDVMQDEGYFLWVTSLAPLRQKGFILSALPPATANGRPLQGVQVVRANRSDVQLYFDAGSHLLVKATFKAREAGILVGKEYHYAEHRDFDGVKVPTRITVLQNGKKVEDWTAESYRFPVKIDEKVFAKP